MITEFPIFMPKQAQMPFLRCAVPKGNQLFSIPLTNYIMEKDDFSHGFLYCSIIPLKYQNNQIAMFGQNSIESS